MYFQAYQLLEFEHPQNTDSCENGGHKPKILVCFQGRSDRFFWLEHQSLDYSRS